MSKRLPEGVPGPPPEPCACPRCGGPALRAALPLAAASAYRCPGCGDFHDRPGVVVCLSEGG